MVTVSQLHSTTLFRKHSVEEAPKWDAMAFTRRCIRSTGRSTVEPADSERLVPDVRFTRRCSARLSSDVRFAREVVAQTGRYSNVVDRLEKLLAVDISATLTNLDQRDVQPRVDKKMCRSAPFGRREVL